MTDVSIEPGYLVDDSDDDDPVLLGPDGARIDTWREGYPYDERLSRAEYDTTKRLLQIELLKLQNWVKQSGTRIVILFEGRDAAGKAARSSASRSTSTPAARGSSHSRSPPSASRRSGTSSATCNTCPRPGRSCCSTAAGTSAQASNG